MVVVDLFPTPEVTMYWSILVLVTGCTRAGSTQAGLSGDPWPVDTLLDLIGNPAALLLPRTPADDASAEAYVDFPQSKLNPLTPEKVALGKALFFEPGIQAAPRRSEGLHSVSCGTCHDPEAGFGSGSVIGLGIGEGGVGARDERRVRDEYADHIWEVDLGPWNDTRLINAGFRGTRAGWQGEFDSTLTDEQRETYHVSPSPLCEAGYEGLECYIDMALFSHGFFSEAATPPADSVLSPRSDLAAHLTYRDLFDAAFPEEPEPTRMTRLTTSLAISSFVRTLVADDAPFQDFLRAAAEGGGDAASGILSDAAVEGGILFFGDAACARCHTGPGFTAAEFATLGTPGYDPDSVIPGAPSEEDANAEMSLTEFFAYRDNFPAVENRGRMNITLDEADLGAYVIASPYGAGSDGVSRFGHGAFHTSLEAFVDHKLGGRQGASIDPLLAGNLDPRLFHSDGPVLDEEQIANVVAFVREGLTDPLVFAKYGLADHRSLAGFCAPNNDPESCAAYGIEP